MLKIGILGSSGRVGSLLIDDINLNENTILSSVHVFDKLSKDVPKDTVVTNDIKTLVNNCEVVIDFSAPNATEELLNNTINNNTAIGE